MSFFSRFFGPPTRQQFAKKFMKMMTQVGDPRIPKYDDAEFRITYTQDGKPAGISSLHNLYLEYCQVPWRERPSWLRRTCIGLGKMPEPPEDFADAKPDLYPSLKSRSFLETLRRQVDDEKADQAAALPHVQVSEHLIVCLAYDLPTSMCFVTQEMLDKWDVTVYEAMEVALKNLAEREYQLAGMDDKLYTFVVGDAYDASRLLLTDLLRGLKLNGDVLALPMTRDSLLITGADDDKGIELMLGFAETQVDNPRPICSIPVRLVGDEWETWQPPPDHPLYMRFHVLAMRYYGGEYGDQKAYLEKVNEKNGIDVFVASYGGLSHKDGRELSYAVWSKGVPTWLPQVDQIAFCDPDTDMTELVPWQEAVTLVGNLMTPLDLYPTRWEVTDFPTPEQISELKRKGASPPV